MKKQNEHLEDSCADVSLDSFNQDKLELMKAPEENLDLKHPTPEEMLIRQAVKYLTPKQRRVWDLYNYDKWTRDQIGEKLGISHQAVCKHISACEKRIAKWCRSNMGAYKLLKSEFDQ